MPSSNHAVDKPVPEPSSRKRADGLDAANVRSKEQVSDSDAIVNPEARVSAHIAGMAMGSLRLKRSFMFCGGSTVIGMVEILILLGGYIIAFYIGNIGYPAIILPDTNV
ncbi:MAG: hypothetical protein AWT59_3268 [Candidatus Gallionella acididurans]|uniref:Uncharacterized protein n=1 Tax=Candidatus Gallionella acididurans TaxID=1796491 RepID=A0A139BNS8_9PROT|nr:MAG: hypothetical protein AWT59_3268 [Candidatus Gallionella acididurans]